MSASLATSETLKRATKFVASDTQMFLGEHPMSPRDSVADMLLPILGRHAGYNAGRDMSVSLA